MCVERLYSFEEAGELLQVSTSTLRKKVAAGLVPHRKVFRHVRFSAGDLQQMQELRGPQPDSKAGTGRQRARPVEQA